MPEDNFRFSQNQSQEAGKTERNASAPPLDLSKAQPLQGVYFIPEEALPPKKWRKRHPKLFLGLILLSLFILANICSGIYQSLDESGVFSGPRLGIVRIEGMILDSEDTVAWLDYLEKNDSVHGVLLYINSGGGAVVPSQEIYTAVKRLSERKPVVSYLSTAGASGGYYIAVGSDAIVASPSTLTGSIGVRMELVEMQQLFDTIGVRQQGLSSGPLKEAGTPFRPLRPDEEEYLQGIVQDMYEVFIQDVATGRNLDLEYVRGLADGRAYTGRQALELGLIDELGDTVTALNILGEMAGLTEPVSEYLDGPPEKKSLMQELVQGAIQDIVKGTHAAQNKPLFYY